MPQYLQILYENVCILAITNMAAVRNTEIISETFIIDTYGTSSNYTQISIIKS